MKKILITGASGFIGSFLVDEAINRNWQTWACIRERSSREYLSNENIRFIDLNYSNISLLKQQIQEHVATFGKWDYIIHNAGVTKCLNPADFEKINYYFTRNLIEALIDTKSIPDKFILMSSLSSYPDAETAYGRSKFKAENLLRTLKDFPSIILRPTGVYGPREKDYFLMIKSIAAGLDVTAGFKPQKLTFIYVKDLVKATYLALQSPIQNKDFAIADGDVYSGNEYTQIVKKELQKARVLRIKVPLFILKIISIVAEECSKISKKPSTLNRDKYKIMKKRDWTCDTTPAKEQLEFQADYNLKLGIQESIHWYRENHWL